MSSLLLMLKDRRRAQRGSVLSGVLIMVAFLGVISGALMTELSGSFVSSRILVNRVTDEATVSSALELAINQLQNHQLGTATQCPALSPLAINGKTAVVSYINCAAGSRFNPAFVPVASGSPFTTDGTHVVLGSPWNVDEYLVSDISTNVSAFDFGQTTPRWTQGVEGILTGPPTAMGDVPNAPGVIDMVPVTDPDDGNTNPNCGSHGFCVAVLTQDNNSQTPQLSCFMQANARVTAAAAGGRDYRDLAYFGDAAGNLYAYSPTGGQGGDGGGNRCAPIDSAQVPGGQAIIAGPVIFPCTSRNCSADHIYVVTSDGTSSRLVHFMYSAGSGFSNPSSLVLPYANARGLALESSTLPARLAISFGGGGLAVVQLSNGFGMSLATNANVGSAIAAAPFWCSCPDGALVGAGGQDGTLRVRYAADLSLYGNYAGGPAINTTPTADGAGDWFFGADDGFVYEVQRPAGTTMTLATRFGSLLGRIGSSPLLGGCPTGICIYLATRNSAAYLIRLDTRDTLITACLSTAPPNCSGDNPRLWAHVQVGAGGVNQTVHVSGWSYYSP